MDENTKAIDNAIASTNLEGLSLRPEVVEIIKKSLSEDHGDKSFLYELVRMLEEDKNEHQR